MEPCVSVENAVYIKDGELLGMACEAEVDTDIFGFDSQVGSYTIGALLSIHCNSNKLGITNW